jgi:8-oxo-dGTP pyrophosphatase MutT (NUDIX family)
MLLRDGPEGLEVLMMVRHDAADFAGGALVFPGGRVSPVDERVAAAHPPVPAGEGASQILKIAAIRETFEEAGILLARRRRAATIVSAVDLDAIGPSGTDDEHFARLLQEGGLVPATDLLVPFANWITPVVSRKRFDTHFFVAGFSGDQVPCHDGQEAVEVLWTTPDAAIAAGDAGRRSLLTPTLLNLRRLAASASVEAALAAARRSTIVPVTPELVRTGSGMELHIPEAAGYGVTRLPAVIPRKW